MAELELGPALRAAQAADPGSVNDVVLRIAADLGASDVVLYLADFAQTSLEPVPDRGTHADVSGREDIGSSMAGRAFSDQRATTATRADGVRVWVPVVEGSDRTGVLALSVPEASDGVIRACEELGLFAGYLIATQARATDLFNLYRRRRALSLAASMQWDLLPPLVLKTARLGVACLLEPAYEVGGDCFDYAMNDTTFDVGILDAMGHGVVSALTAALSIGSYRHDRREGRSLEHISADLDAAMANHLPDSFATGQLARIDVDTGHLTWVNAGHPFPLLIRGGRVVGQLECTPTLPWGFGALATSASAAHVATESLEPGDGVLFYTDGVVEARMPDGERFGVDRLADLAGQHASDLLEPEEIVRRIVRAVLDHQGDELSDDATLVFVQWNG